MQSTIHPQIPHLQTFLLAKVWLVSVGEQLHINSVQHLQETMEVLVLLYAIAKAFTEVVTCKVAQKVNNALAGNRTRVSRVAGENSTTEPPMLC